MRSDTPRVVDQMFQVCRWVMARAAKFPRTHRFGLGERLVARSLDILETLSEAAYTRDKRELLQRANRDLEKLRLLGRLAFEERLLSADQLGYLSVQLHEAGAQVGGWLKQQERR